MSAEELLAELEQKLGTETHASPWITMTQERINDFAAATDDRQWIHTDPERAARESPYGSTIAHGYLTLSLYPYLRDLVNPDRPVYPGVKQVINYGIDKLRFPNAVRTGNRVRGRTELIDARAVKGGLQTTERYTVEIEGEERPACVAEVVMRLYL